MFKVVIVADRERACKVIEEYKPHVIFTDMEMPETGHLLPEGGKGFIVKNAVKYIEKHYSEKLTLMEVAEQTYVSPWHLSKLLNSQVGQGFSEILNLVRIQHAKELLRDQSLRVGDVAETVGFMNVSHFSRVFKKIEGMSANEYRNRLR